MPPGDSGRAGWYGALVLPPVAFIRVVWCLAAAEEFAAGVVLGMDGSDDGRPTRAAPSMPAWGTRTIAEYVHESSQQIGEGTYG